MKHQITLPILLILVSVARTQIPLSTPIPIVTTPLNTIVDQGDLDGDGDLDLLVRSSNGTFTHWENTGGGVFTPGPAVLTTSSTLTSPQSQWADIDGDGRLDIVASSVGLINPMVSIYRGLPAGGYAAAVTIPQSSGINALLAADANNDGFDDILVGTPAPMSSILQRVHWIFGGPNLATTTGTPLDAGDSSILFLADVDVDGDLDVIYQKTQPPRDSFAVSFSNGTGWDSHVSIPFSPLPSPFFTNQLTLIPGDFDGDQDADILGIWTSQPAGQVLLQVARRDPMGWVLEPQQIFTGTFGQSGRAGDIDGDGDDDIVLNIPTGLSTFTCLGDNKFKANGTFNPAGFPTVLNSRQDVFADLNQDGFEDWIGPTSYWLSPGSAALWGASSREQKFFADSGGDGDVDWIDSNGQVRENLGDGSVRISSLPNGFLPPLPSPNIWTIDAQGDFNGDGFTDLIATERIPTTPFSLPLSTDLLLNDRNISLLRQGPVGGAGDPVVAVSEVRDFDGDGLPDIRSANILYFSNGATPFVSFALPAGFTLADVGDADGDGDNDLLMTDSGPIFSTWIFRTDGIGLLTPFLIGQPTVSNDTAKFGDLDSDGDLDVVFIEVAGGVSRLVTLENVGNGMAPIRRTMNLANGATRVLVGDMDNDGFADLVVGGAAPGVTTSTGISTILTNLGGTFAFNVGVRFFGTPLHLMDFDRDGDLDLTTAEFNTGMVIHANLRFGPGDTGRALQYEDGTPGSSGLRPLLGGVGPWRAGAQVSIIGTSLLGGSIGLLAIGSAPDMLIDSPLPGINTYINGIIDIFPVQADGVPGVAGDGRLSITSTIPLGLSGSLYLQAGFIDPGQPSMLSVTNGLRLDIVN